MNQPRVAAGNGLLSGRFAGVPHSEANAELVPTTTAMVDGMWDADGARREAASLRALLAEAVEDDVNPFGRRDVITPDDVAEQKARLVELNERVCGLGDRIAAEAEERAGVSADGIVARRERRIDELKQQVDSLNESADRAKATWMSMPRDIDPQVADAKRSEWVASANSAHETRDLLRSIEHGTDDETRSDLARLSDAYRDVLSEMRELGGSVDYFYDGANKKALASQVARVMDGYPSDWIAASNTDADEVPLNLEPVGRDRSARGRAYYGHRIQRTVRKRERATGMRMYQSPDWRPDASDPDEADLIAVGEPHERTTVEMVDGQRVLRREMVQAWASPAWNYRSVPPSRGKDWEQVPDRQTGEWRSWRQPRYEMREHDDGLVAQLRVHKPSDPGAAETLTHEFVHRFEHTVPGITLLEREHLRSRTTREDGTVEAPRAYHSSRRFGHEVVLEDGFAERYMGKQYPRVTGTPGFERDVPEAYELLSCAVPGLMCGQHGGLVGAGRTKRDLQSRAFALGTLAVV